MGITWVENADSRVDLGINVIQQEGTGTPGFSDYLAGTGYSVPPSAFGLSGSTGIRSVTPCGYTGTAINYDWRYNKTTRMLQVFQGGTEVSTGTNIAGSITVEVNGY